MSYNHGGCCAKSCCGDVREIREGECITIPVCFREAITELGARTLDQRMTVEVKSFRESSTPLDVTYTVHSADAVVGVTVQGGQAGSDYQVDMFVNTETCNRLHFCFMVKVGKCR